MSALDEHSCMLAIDFVGASMIHESLKRARQIHTLIYKEEKMLVARIIYASGGNHGGPDHPG